MSRFSIYPASFVHAGGTLHLRQMRSQTLTRNGSFNSIRPGGGLDNTAHILSTANPTAGFATRDLSSLFSAGTVSLTTGLYCTGGHSMRWQKRLTGGAFDPTAVHVVQTTPKGFLHPVQIEADIDSNTGAECTLEYVALSSDGTNPVTTSTGSALGGQTPLFGSCYYLGGCYLNGTPVTGLIRQRVVPGISYTARRSDGGVFSRADCSSISARDPSIQIDFLNVPMIDTVIGSFFAASLSASLDVYFQLGSVTNDGRVAAGSASHLKISAPAGTWGPNDVSVADEGDGVVTVAVMPSSPLTLNASSAIP